jgi:hypothetical protein
MRLRKLPTGTRGSSLTRPCWKVRAPRQIPPPRCFPLRRKVALSCGRTFHSQLQPAASDNDTIPNAPLSSNNRQSYIQFPGAANHPGKERKNAARDHRDTVPSKTPRRMPGWWGSFLAPTDTPWANPRPRAELPDGCSKKLNFGTCSRKGRFSGKLKYPIQT